MPSTPAQHSADVVLKLSDASGLLHAPACQHICFAMLRHKYCFADTLIQCQDPSDASLDTSTAVQASSICVCGAAKSCPCQVADPQNPKRQTESQELIKFDGPKDSVYLKARDYVELDVGTGG